MQCQQQRSSGYSIMFNELNHMKTRKALFSIKSSSQFRYPKHSTHMLYTRSTAFGPAHHEDLKAFNSNLSMAQLLLDDIGTRLASLPALVQESGSLHKLKLYASRPFFFTICSKVGVYFLNSSMSLLINCCNLVTLVVNYFMIKEFE